MDVFNKIKSAVSGALPGNPLSKDFDVLNHVASGGPGLLWKIYNAVQRTTKQEAAVFMFEKRQLEKYSKRDREIIIESLKKGVSQLTRLRHPKVLSVLNPLEESREMLAFATEPVFASLANVLGNHDNMPNPLPRDLQGYKLFEVEIKHGLLQVTEGLGFLHNDVKLMHSNICPESLIINKNGSWKLAGFDFCIPNANAQDQNPLFPYREWDPEIPPIAQPNLDYMAPEYALTMTCSQASDMFSIGVLIHAIFNDGKALYECKCQLSLFKKYSEELRKFRSSLLGNVPTDLHEYVKLLLNTEPTVRPDSNQLCKIPFFEDVGSMTLQFMDTLFQRDNLQKSQFFKGLPKIISKLPKRVNIQRILPPMLKESVNPDMIPFLLPNILLIAEQSTDQEYTTIILPELVPMFKIREPVQVLLIFMQNMNLLLKKTPQAEIRNHVLPMIHQALEADSPQLQEICLSIIPTFAELIEFTSLRNSIIPRIKKLCLATSTLTIRVNCLLCIGKLLEYMDKWSVIDDVLPLLPQIPSREPAVLMSILGIYQVTMTHAKLGITKDLIANKVLPFVIPLAIDSNLNLPQFNAFMSTIKEMLSKMETEHRSKLEQIDQMKQEQKSIEITTMSTPDDKQLIGTVDQAPKSMMDKFLSGFGISSMLGSGDKSSGQKPNPAAAAASTSNDQPEGPASVPAKTSLSLEEKQRLAKQQEQQRMYKSQKPLNTSTTPKTASTTPPKQQVKDLTSSLMNSNMMGLQNSSSNSRTSSVGQSSMGMSNASSMGQSSSSRTIGQSSYGMSNTGSLGQNSYSGGSFGMGQTSMNKSSVGMMGHNSMPIGGQSSQMQYNQQAKQQMDLSAFDSLMSGSGSSQNNKMSLNQMAHQTTQNTQRQFGTGGMGYMGGTGNTGMMGNMGMMGNVGQMSGIQPMNQGMGMQNMGQFNQGYMQNPLGMQSNMPTSQMGQTNFQQQSQNMASQSSASSNDIADIFG